MTRALTEATARLEAATAEADAIEEFEAYWSAGARRARIERLREEQLAAADAEARERDQLTRNADRLAGELEELYAPALGAMAAFVEAAEAVAAKRAEYVNAWRRAKTAGVPVAPLVPNASIRAATQRGDALDLVRRLRRASSQNDW